jgi:alpha-ketoglutarate-dependent taurine dioxygenase
MSTESKKLDIATFASIRREPISGPQQNQVRESYLRSGKTFPLVIQPLASDLALAGWAAGNREAVEARLLTHGAILFRNFKVNSSADLERFIDAMSGQALEYRERSSPRSRVSGNIYTSTDYPASKSIFPHNEHSYSRTFPLKLFFLCERPAQQGGETPIGNCRSIAQHISPEIRERFIQKNYMYVRNFGDGMGLPWQTAFQTTDKATVERYCRSAGIEAEWKSNDRLRTRQLRPAVATHPKTGETVWFNHATFFNVSTLDAEIRDALLEEFSEEDLPNNTYYGDGSRIEASVLEELRGAYQQEMVSFPWQRGDVLMIDNMLSVHARSPFKGARSVLVGMSEPHTRSDIAGE